MPPSLKSVTMPGKDREDSHNAKSTAAKHPSTVLWRYKLPSKGSSEMQAAPLRLTPNGMEREDSLNTTRCNCKCPHPLSLGGTKFPPKAHPKNCNPLPSKDCDDKLNATEKVLLPAPPKEREDIHNTKAKLSCKPPHARHYCWLQSCLTPPASL